MQNTAEEHLFLEFLSFQNLLLGCTISAGKACTGIGLRLKPTLQTHKFCKTKQRWTQVYLLDTVQSSLPIFWIQQSKSCNYTDIKPEQSQTRRSQATRKVTKPNSTMSMGPICSWNRLKVLAFHVNIIFHVIKFTFILKGLQMGHHYPAKQLDILFILFAFRQLASRK